MSASIFVPLVTPLRPDRRPDLDSLGSLIDFVAGAGVDGVLVMGSSGEAVALGAADRVAVVEGAVAHARGRLRVIAGVPTHGTADAIEEARSLSALGVDLLLVAAPAGLALSTAELSGHFQAVADAVASPVIAYEVPSRVGTSLPTELLAQLAAKGAIAGVKDSSGALARTRATALATMEVPGFVRYTGSEETIDAALMFGCHGAIPGLANVFPEFHVALARRASAGDWAAAARIQRDIVRLLALYAAPLPDASPVARFFAAVKGALVQRGIIAYSATSIPLSQADDRVRQHAAAVLELADGLRASLDGNGQ